MINQSRSSIEPTLKDILDMHKREVMLSLNCHAIGTIQSFDPVKQTCRATINYSKTVFERDEKGNYKSILKDYPILADCPVIVLTGGTAGLTMPIKTGDTCLILFNDRDIDNWYKGANSGPVNSPRLHSMSDALCLVGLRSSNNRIANYDSDNPVLFNQNLRVVPKANKLLVENSSDSLGALLNDLTTKLQDLVTQINAITVICAAPGNPSSVPVNSANIALIGTDIALISTKLNGLLE